MRKVVVLAGLMLTTQVYANANYFKGLKTKYEIKRALSKDTISVLDIKDSYIENVTSEDVFNQLASIFKHIEEKKNGNYDLLIGPMTNVIDKMKIKKLEKFSVKEKQELVGMLIFRLRAEVQIRGLLGSVNGEDVEYTDWPKLSKQVASKISTSKYFKEAINEEQSFESESFSKLINEITKEDHRFRSFEKLSLLRNPTDALNQTLEIIHSSKNVYVSTWALYDDLTGKIVVNALIKKANKGEKVFLMLDGNTAQLKKHKKELKRMEGIDNIEILKFKDKDFIGLGSHRKFITNGEDAIIGGRNYGNFYSHLGNTQKWRDLDIRIKGNAAQELYNVFARVWNTNESTKTKLEKKKIDEVLSGSRVAIIDHVAGPLNKQGDTNVLSTIVSMIKLAKKEILIENAYFIDMAPIRNALIEKVSTSNVKVKIFTNSNTSVDEPIVANPIMQTARKMALLPGVEVFLQNDETLHAKVIQVDGKATLIGSYNFHPRSFRYEGETMALVIDEQLGSEYRDELLSYLSSEGATKLVPKQEVAPKNENKAYEIISEMIYNIL